MTQNELREKIQNEAVELAIKYPYYIAEFATGVGKSLTAIRIIETLGGKWNLVVAETNHILNWIDEFKKHGKEKLTANITFLCYASLHKYEKDEQYIFDEIHHLLNSNKRLNSLEEIISNGCTRLIGLSATVSRKLKWNLKEIIPNVYYHKVPLSEAIDKGLLPEPVVHLIGIELDNTKFNETFKFSKDKIIKCTQLGWYKNQENRITYFKNRYLSNRTEFNKTAWLRAGKIRKDFLANAKTPYAKVLLNKLKGKRLICFTHSIAQSEELSKGNSIHSNISTELREDMIKDFNEGKIDKLYTTKMLREGMNLNNIEAGIMVQLDNNMKSFYQTAGRVLRSSFPEYYIFYVKGTQDEKYLETALEGFNEDYIVKTTLNEL